MAIESPPYFHPEQAAAAVDAGKPRLRGQADRRRRARLQDHRARAARRPPPKKLCFLVDFQTRADEFYIEALKRVHDGRHRPSSLSAKPPTTPASPGPGQIKYCQQDPDNPENRLRAWGLDRVLSGDIITEQNIHTLDVASWIMNQPPVCAYGTGGQQGPRLRHLLGHVQRGLPVPRQRRRSPSAPGSSTATAPSPTASATACSAPKACWKPQYGGDVLIRGKNFYRGGSTPTIYKQGAVNNIATFHASIQQGDCSNPTVADSVRSNLVTILGRTAAYEGRVVTWQEVPASNQRLEADLKGLKA